MSTEIYDAYSPSFKRIVLIITRKGLKELIELHKSERFLHGAVCSPLARTGIFAKTASWITHARWNHGRRMMLMTGE